MTLVKLNKFINDKIGSSPALKKHADAYIVLLAAQKYIAQKLPEAAAKITKAAAFSNCSLTIASQSSVVITELKLREKDLLRFIKNDAPGIEIQKLRLLLI